MGILILGLSLFLLSLGGVVAHSPWSLPGIGPCLAWIICRMGFAPLEANSGGGWGLGGWGWGLGPLGQRQALFLFFSLPLSPFGPCSLWSLSMSLGTFEVSLGLVTIICLVLWPACLLNLWALGGFGGLGPWASDSTLTGLSWVGRCGPLILVGLSAPFPC